MSENNSKGMTVFTVVTTVVGLFIGVAEVTGVGFISGFFEPNTRFSCTLQPDTKTGKEIWTVMYSKGNKQIPWLRMVNSFGDDWNTRRRCNKIADRLDRFLKDGLTDFGYRTDPNTPNQSVICAYTKIAPNNCNLLVTLKPGADGYESLSKMLEALKTGTTVNKSSGDNVNVSPNSTKVNIENLLAPEDRKINK